MGLISLFMNHCSKYELTVIVQKTVVVFTPEFLIHVNISK